MDCLKFDEDKKVEEFYNHYFNFGLIPIINRPTRITQDSCTAIDNALINYVTGTNLMSGIIKTDISDHFPIFLIIKDLTICKSQSKTRLIQKRIFSQDKLHMFTLELSKNNWDCVYQENDINKSYNNFINTFKNLFDQFFPVIEQKVKTKTLLNPWFTKGFEKSSRKKQKLYNRFLKSRSSHDKSTYLAYKNLFEKLKTEAKSKYYKDLLLKHQGNAKQTWKTLKELLGKQKNSFSSSLPHMISINKQNHFQEESIANNFNDFFINIGTKLTQNIAPSNNHFTDYLTYNNSNLIMKNVTYAELDAAIKALQKNKSPGYDEIPSNIVLTCYPELRDVLRFLFNKSVKSGIFPDQMKVAKVTPVFKTGETSQMTNYRPISVLPVFSKLLERIIYNRVYNFITEQKLLFRNQFGFQSSHSTEHAILEFIDNILKSFDNGQMTLGVFIDLSKAFDTVDHEILLQKLKFLGIRGTYLKWFKSYLNNRKQFIPFDNGKKQSLWRLITCGVPQGSILGPLLFLLYVNDLHKASNQISAIMFADDTNLFYSHSDLNTLYQKMNEELIKITQWFSANKLSLNLKKTQYSLFHSNNKKSKIPESIPTISINGMEITRSNTSKFLGVIIDENLNWKYHLLHVRNKISKNIGILYKLRHLVDEKSLTQLYFSFINSYINYGNCAWASTNKTRLKPIYIKQKQAARAIYFKDRYTHAKPLLKKMNALDVYQINIFKHLCFMFNYINNVTPTTFENRFTTVTNKYTTRNSGLFKKPFCRTKMATFSISYRAPHIWNEFASSHPAILKAKSLNSFKHVSKKEILSYKKTDSLF